MELNGVGPLYINERTEISMDDVRELPELSDKSNFKRENGETDKTIIPMLELGVGTVTVTIWPLTSALNTTKVPMTPPLRLHCPDAQRQLSAPPHTYCIINFY